MNLVLFSFIKIIIKILKEDNHLLDEDKFYLEMMSFKQLSRFFIFIFKNKILKSNYSKFRSKKVNEFKIWKLYFLFYFFSKIVRILILKRKK